MLRLSFQKRLLLKIMGPRPSGLVFSHTVSDAVRAAAADDAEALDKRRAWQIHVGVRRSLFNVHGLMM